MKLILSLLLSLMFLSLPLFAQQPPFTTGAPMAQVIYSPDANDTYICTAPVGTITSAAKWQCSYLYVNGTTTTITWANGSTSFTNVATSPGSLSYS